MTEGKYISTINKGFPEYCVSNMSGIFLIYMLVGGKYEGGFVQFQKLGKLSIVVSRWPSPYGEINGNFDRV